MKGKHGPLLIAEIGGNHEGDFEYAKHLTELAIQTDVDYIKFQIYSGESLVSSIESPDRNLHFKRFQLTKKEHLFLASLVKDAGIGYLSSVWDYDSISWIDEYLDLYKIGSGDITAYPLLKLIAQIGKPIILSTGISTEQEVIDAVRYIRSINPNYNNKEMLGVLQCTAMYPIANGDAHLNVMSKLKEITKATVGYSDHTEGIDALRYAAVMGAEILEFHFTDSREGKEFRDHAVSLVPSEVNSLINEIKIIKEFQGKCVKRPLQIELDNGHDVSFRRAVYPSKDINKGALLSQDNLTVLRPNHGIDARYYDQLIGKKAKKNIKRHEKLSWSIIE
ncbi:N-acetylneuraminate synthase family protein [Methanoplanus endosymbiosus]|uniref:N-acetylneuraminate synthase family protein n=1 Tax=Methanoplanus endosymbiosus TaxID=33865 RepID=A0A9E7TH48_9EURY|nr:N-acetylneuraminate synthase family protein [Methanoplanus endosymbiosus]UUX92247.1 N-acetylneuraminate synthase family protein [Methanoplanus endosymbiosus]